ncbi:MAG TPA: hypothetical protein V6D07_13650 [Trichocoleus sp.]
MNALTSTGQTYWNSTVKPTKSNEKPTAWKLGLCGLLGIGTTLATGTATLAQTVFPATPGLDFQTSGPLACGNIGDWYTANGPGDPNACAGDLSIANFRTANGISARHEFFINVTQADLAQGPIAVQIEDAEVGGSRDEIRGGAADPAQFRLFDANGNEISSNLPSGIVNPGSPDGTILSFVPITQPGVYRLVSLTGGLRIPGASLPGGSALTDNNRNNDDNSFTLRIPVISNLLVGQFQGSFQRPLGAGSVRADFFFLVGPGTQTLLLRNFDLDNNGPISYTGPRGPAPVTPTVSGQSRWNGAGNLNTGGDQFNISPTADAGIWNIVLANFRDDNQSILEANSVNPDNTQVRLPLLDVQPTRAGNFSITPDTERSTSIDSTVCHPFSVLNRFFTTDIINLRPTLNGADLQQIQGLPAPLYRTADGYEVQFRDASGQTPLGDTDGDGRVDTGTLAANGGIGNFTLCVTPRSGAPAEKAVTINASSFMDTRIRQQSGSGPATEQTVVKLTRIGETSTLSLVKRITRVFRSATGTVETYAAALPGGTADFVGVDSPQPLLLQPGDLVEYAIYYANTGDSQITNVEICDPVPARTQFVADPTSVGAFQDLYQSSRSLFFRPPAALPLVGGSSLSNVFDGDAGEFANPLTPRGSCLGETTGNQGAVVVRVGTVAPGAAGVIKFVTQVE